MPGRFGFGPLPDKFPVHEATPASVKGCQAPRWSTRRPRFRVRRRVAFQSSWMYPETVGYQRLSRAERLTWLKLPTPMTKFAIWLLDPQCSHGLVPAIPVLPCSGLVAQFPAIGWLLEFKPPAPR